MKTKKKILLAVFAIFCTFQLFFIYKRIHNYPFMIYDMYSRPESEAQLSNQFLIVADNDTINMASLPLMEEGRLRKNLGIYAYHQLKGIDYWNPALTSRQDRWTGGILQKSRLRERSDLLLRNSTDKIDEFPFWLKDYLEAHLGKEINTLKVSSITYGQAADKIFDEKALIHIHFEQ